MSHIITELWYGNIRPCETCGVPDPEGKRIHARMDQYREKLWNTLTDTQKEQFDQYAAGSDEYLFHMMELAFSDGFALGTRVAAEVFVQN